MPELPEVETIRLGLQQYLVGHTIEGVEVRLPKLVTGNVKDIIGAKVTAVERFGKGLVIGLDNDYCIAIHIKLTGQLIYQDASNEPPKEIKVIKGTYSTLPNKWTHVIFKLKTDSHSGKRSASRIDSGPSARMTDAYLYYNDFRQFGWIKIIKKEDIKQLEFFRDLGPEFFKDLTLEKFMTILASSKTPVKVMIMDQKKMSGVGNIYANDSLNLAKLDPKRPAKTLSKEEAITLFKAIEKVLKKGLETGGASELSYINALGQEGSYQKHFIAYGRDGKPCKNCGESLKKIILGGRGTYFCPLCQK